MQDYSSSPLLSLIKERNLLDDLQLEELAQELERSGKSVGEVLNNLGFVDVDLQMQIMAEHLGNYMSAAQSYSSVLLRYMMASLMAG